MIRSGTHELRSLGRTAVVYAGMLAFLALVAGPAWGQPTAAAAVGSTPEAPDATWMADAFAGAIDDELFIGILAAEHPSQPGLRTWVIYLCDGATTSTWLFGEGTGDDAVVRQGDTQVELSLRGPSVHGVVDRVGETPRLFVAEFATALAGLYRSVETIEGNEYVGGWIVLDDGRQRGAITLGGRVVDNPTLDPESKQAVSTVGTFGSNCFRDPRTGDRICRYMN
jgi:hypothetical protein